MGTRSLPKWVIGLALAVLVDLELVLREPGDEPAVHIHDRGGDADQVDARLETAREAPRAFALRHAPASVPAARPISASRLHVTHRILQEGRDPDACSWIPCLRELEGQAYNRPARCRSPP